MGRPGQIATIARSTVLEAWRTRFAVMLAVLLAVALGMALFSGELAITETRQTQAALTAAFLRLGLVLLTALFVIGSVSREFADKVADLTLSLPLPRAGWFLGRLAGFMAVAGLSVLPVMALLLAFAPAPAVALWGLTLLGELLIVSAAALAFALTFTQLMPAFAAFLAFYLLARTIEAIRLMAHGPLVTENTAGERLLVRLVDGVGWLLPDLARFGRSAWLAYTPDWSALGPVAGQSLVYVLLLASVGLFDLYRRNL